MVFLHLNASLLSSMEKFGWIGKIFTVSSKTGWRDLNRLVHRAFVVNTSVVIVKRSSFRINALVLRYEERRII